MTIKLLIVGQLASSSNVGTWLINACEDLELSVESFDTSFSSYAPSMKNILGRIFFKLSDKRPLEWWDLSHKLIAIICQSQPQIVILTGIMPLQSSFFFECHKLGIKTVNYLTDNPFSKNLYCKKYLDNISKYDFIASTKSGIVDDLYSQRGARQVKFLPFAYDPVWHRLPDNVSDGEKAKFTSDISFVGTGDTERLVWLDALADIENTSLKLFGNDWNNIQVNGWQKYPEVVENDFRLAINLSKISLGLLRKSRRDRSTQRTFEIAPCGGCGIYEDTQEHREILSGYPDHGFFNSPEDLADKCRWLLENSDEREKMRQLGIKIIVHRENTFAARLESIISLLNTGEKLE